jgi:hypothetical protein
VVARVPHFWSVDLLANGALHWSALRNQSESFLRLVSDYFYLLSHWLFYFWLCRHSKKNREWNYETDKQYSMLLFLKSSHIMFFFFFFFPSQIIYWFNVTFVFYYWFGPFICMCRLYSLGHFIYAQTFLFDNSFCHSTHFCIFRTLI